MTAIWVCGALERARSERMRWQTTMAASAGTVSTEECSTVRSGRTALMRLRKRVAPMAEESMPASQAKTILASSVLEMTTASAVPSWERRSSAASSAAAGAVARSMGAATANETPAEMATPAMVGSI